MYAETGILFPYFQNFSHEIQQLEEFCKSQNPNSSLASTVSEYDLGGEGDLFKAPEPIIAGMDPMSMISCGDDGISLQGFKQSDIESFQTEQLFSDVFYECKKDLLEKAARESSFSDVVDMKFLVGMMDEENLLPGLQFQKSVSSGCLSAMEWLSTASVRPTFLDFPGLDFGSVYGMRRAYSEGDIKTLSNENVNGDTNTVQCTLEQSSIISNCTSELRKEKLSRYRNKKTKRNFGRKIKYACRKALADSQPRIRGRFAKTEESDPTKVARIIE